MCLNALGLIVDRAWARTSEIRAEVAIDVFAVMPNHLHGLITINPPTCDAV
jgi:REP element-mobilizing transposase RayT